MAFNTGTTSNNNFGNGSSTNDNWKAKGFINVFLPARDGTRVKLGSIPLKDSKPREKELCEWLEKDPANVAKLLDMLQLDYQSAEPSDAKGFALPD